MLGRMIPVAVFGAIGTLIFAGLGWWQVERLAWKTDLIARIEASLAADPVAVPQMPEPDRDRYLHVRERGAILPGELHVYTSAPPRGVGYRVIAPMQLADGRRILVDRGFVPVGEKDATRQIGPVTVEGALQWPRETDGFTAAPDREKNIWLARDVAQMSAALETQPIMLVTEASDMAAAPMPLPVGIDIPNSHLQYVITWFGFAAIWAGMTVYRLWRIKRRIE